jgi:hypothetical protein
MQKQPPFPLDREAKAGLRSTRRLRLPPAASDIDAAVVQWKAVTEQISDREVQREER